MKITLLLIVFITIVTGLNADAREKTETAPGVEEIFKEVHSSVDTSQVSDAKGEVDKIIKEAGEYTGVKLPQFPSITNPAMGFSLDLLVPSLSDEKNAYESANILDMREMGINVYGSVDPFTKAFATIVGRDSIVVDEVYLLSSALPYNIQVRAGRQFANFGRLNKVHPHDLPFVDYPLALQNFLGTPAPETDPKRVALTYTPGFNSSGAEFLVLMPTDLYWRMILGIYNGFTDRGAGSFYSKYFTLVSPADGWRQKNRGLNSFAYTLNSRWFFELHPDHGMRLELCGLFDNPDEFVKRDLAALTLTYKWEPLGHGLYRGAELCTEIFSNREKFMKNITGFEQDTYGVYSYLIYKLGAKYTLTLFNEWSQFRFDKNAGARQSGAAFSLRPSQMQRVRLQVNHIDQQQWKDSVSRATGIPAGEGKYLQITLQWNVWMGTHMHDFD